MASRTASAEDVPASGGHSAGDRAVLPTRHHGVAVAGIMLATILPLLDTTIANVAIPHMQSALGATPESIMWMLTSYMIAHAIGMPLTGWLAERIGARRLFLLSTTSFIITSMLCGIAMSLEAMVIFRSLQGLSGAFILPLSQSLMLDISRPSQHPKMMTIWGLGAVMGPILGPLIGGWLTENWDWRWVFFVNVPLGILALVLLYFTLPERPQKKRRQFDLFGFSILALGLSALQLMLDRGHHVDWFDSLETWIYFGITVSSLWVLIVHFVTAKAPLFDRAMFGDVNFLISFVFMTLVGIVIYATMALLPPMLQSLMNYSVFDTGLVLAPRGIGAMVAMQLSNRMAAANWDPRISTAIGFACAIWSLYDMAHWSLYVSQSHIIWTGVIQGFGVGFVSLPVFIIAFATLEPRLRTDASGLLNLSRLVGSSVGISVVTAQLARTIQTSHSDLVGSMRNPASDIVDVATISGFREFSESALRLADIEINRQAAMIGYVNDFWLIMWATVVAAPLILLIRRPAAPGAGGASMADTH